MGYPKLKGRVSTQGPARPGKPPPAANDNSPLGPPAKPANDNQPPPANDNFPGDLLNEIGPSVPKGGKIADLVKRYNPVEGVLWSGGLSVLNMIPGFARPIPSDEWSVQNNWRGGLPLYKRWSNDGEVHMEVEGNLSKDSRYTNQAFTPPPRRTILVANGEYLSTYGIRWAGAPLNVWRKDETATYGPAVGGRTARQYVMPNYSPPSLPLPFPLVPLRPNDPFIYVGGYHPPGDPGLQPVQWPQVAPKPSPETAPAPEPVPEPSPRPGKPRPRPEPGEPPIWRPGVDPLPPLWRPPEIPPVIGGQPGKPDWTSPPIGGRPPLTPRRPPGPNVKERKTRASKGLMQVIKFIDDYTEAQDLLNAFYDALPDYLKHKGASDIEKGKTLYQHWNDVDLDTALFNVVSNEIQDRVWGGLGIKRPDARYGGAIGGNRILTGGENGKAIRDQLKAVDQHVRDLLNHYFGMSIKPG